MICSECGTKLKKGTKFCEDCGAKVIETIKKEKSVEKEKTIFCPECGEKNKEGTTFCEDCGAKIKPDEKKKEKPQKMKIRTIIILAIIALGIGAYLTLNNLSKPEKVIENLCSELKKGNYDKIFALYEFPKSDFLTKENYKTRFENTAYKTCKITATNKQDKDTMNYTIKITDEYGDEYENYLTLFKTESKRFLLFDNWKLNSKSIIQREWKISVPKGGKLTVDGKEMKDPETSNSGVYDVYILINLFYIEYDVKVTHPLLEDYEAKLYPDYDTQTTSIIKKDLEFNTTNFLTYLYNAALLNDKSKLNDYISSDYSEKLPDFLKRIKDKIDNAVSWYYYDNIKYRNISISEVETSDIELTESNHIQFRVNYYLQLEYQEDGYDYENYKSRYYLTFEFRVIDNKWELIYAN